MRRYAARILVIGSAALLALQARLVARDFRFYQYDFRSYFIAADLLQRGDDPYSWTELQAESAALGLAENNHPFIYPPHTLFLFLPLAQASYPVAYLLWLAGNCLCIAALYLLCTRSLGAHAALVAPTLAVGLNGALAACLRSGQISLITTFCIVVSVMWLSRNRPALAAAGIVSGGIIKLHTLPLIALVALRPTRRMLLPGVVAGIATLVALAVGRFFLPEGWSGFAHALSALASAPSFGPANGGLRNFISSLIGAWVPKRLPS